MKKPRKIAIWESGKSVARFYATLESGEPVIELHGGSIKDVKKLKQWLIKAESWMKQNKKYD